VELRHLCKSGLRLLMWNMPPTSKHTCSRAITPYALHRVQLFYVELQGYYYCCRYGKQCVLLLAAHCVSLFLLLHFWATNFASNSSPLNNHFSWTVQSWVGDLPLQPGVLHRQPLRTFVEECIDLLTLTVALSSRIR